MSLGDEAQGGDFGPAGPSFKENGLNDGVRGEILHAMENKAMEYNSDKVLTDRNGNEVLQYVVTLQTPLRDWQKVAKIPVDDDGKQLPPSEDTGIRKIYAKYGNKTRLAQALIAAYPDLSNGEIGDTVGMELAVKLAELVPTNKGNDRKDYAYQASGSPKPTGGSLGAEADQGEQEPAAQAQPEPESIPAAPPTNDDPPF